MPKLFRVAALVAALAMSCVGAARAGDTLALKAHPPRRYLDDLATQDIADRDGPAAAAVKAALMAGPHPQAPHDAAGFARLRQAALAGDREAMIEASLAYAQGQGAARNEAAAIAWMAKARGLGRADAMRAVGDCLFDRASDFVGFEGVGTFDHRLTGIYLRRDPDVAAQTLHWYRLAADSGDRLAFERLADMSLRGAGVPGSGPDAVGWFKRAAALGSDHAMGAIAQIYERGVGMTADRAQAIGWYDRAIKAAPDNAAYRNGACWLRAQAGLQLNKALVDCQAATRRAPQTAEYWDSLGLVQMRLGNMAEAETAYGLAVDRFDAEERVGTLDTARSLYGRGVARVRLGRAALGRSDIGFAVGIDPRVAEVFRAYGVAL